ncbi:hypothetical protein B0H16DRAFT_1455119 [Mycena metata]|uniref:Uncharacterized protein n=1 Tax=Mycena metata TaxID=1033252 RepID=A0AAD7JFS8_9AGAR|nr:hypothetical protein B0H16DRAFT_1455119 [Mycena metata]
MTHRRKLAKREEAFWNRNNGWGGKWGREVVIKRQRVRGIFARTLNANAMFGSVRRSNPVEPEHDSAFSGRKKLSERTFVEYCGVLVSYQDGLEARPWVVFEPISEADLASTRNVLGMMADREESKGRKSRSLREELRLPRCPETRERQGEGFVDEYEWSGRKLHADQTMVKCHDQELWRSVVARGEKSDRPVTPLSQDIAPLRRLIGPPTCVRSEASRRPNDGEVSRPSPEEPLRGTHIESASGGRREAEAKTDKAGRKALSKVKRSGARTRQISAEKDRGWEGGSRFYA